MTRIIVKFVLVSVVLALTLTTSAEAAEVSELSPQTTVAQKASGLNALATEASSEFTEGLNRVRQYIRTSKNGPVFDRNAAAAAGEDDEFIELGCKIINGWTREQQEVISGMSAEFRKLADEFSQYVAKLNDLPVFDVNAAVAAGKDDEFIELGRKFNEFGRAMTNPTRDGFPFWGNWCGPGHSGPNPPVDVLDHICKARDQCYEKVGYLACSCDSALLTGIQLGFDKMTALERVAAILVYTWFLDSPCNPFA